MKNGLKTIAVRDIQIHPREKDLIVGTHGHGAWIMDDIRPLQALTNEVLNKEAHLFHLRSATLYPYKSATDLYGTPVFQGENPEFGCIINYFIKQNSENSHVELKITDSSGNIIRELEASKSEGINRVYWDLREKSLIPVSSEMSSRRSRYRRAPQGPYVIPGTYNVILSVNSQKYEKSVEVKSYPKQNISIEDRRLNQKHVRELSQLVAKGNNLLKSINDLDEQLTALEKRMKTEGLWETSAGKKLTSLKADINEIQTSYSYSVEGRTGYRRPVRIALRGGTLPEQISRLLSQINSYPGAPTQTQIDRYNEFQEIMKPLFDKLDSIKEKHIPELNRMLIDINFPVLR